MSSFIWGSWPDIYYCLTVTVLFLWGALPDNRTGLSFYMLLALASAVFLGPESLGLATIFYCLRFETSFFVASYDSHGHGACIPSRLHTGRSQFPSPYSLIPSRHGPRTENTAPLLLHGADHIENKSRDNCLASSLVRWLLRSNEL
jgi:hypothetical protein